MCKRLLPVILLLSIFFISCNSTDVDKKTNSRPLSRSEQIQYNLDSLKRVAASGDLITRLGDDILSYQIKLMNDSDKAYSHTGLIVEREGQKFVAHIAPDEDGGDTLKYIPIDQFLDTTKNLNCALYRYDFSGDERALMASTIDNFKKVNLHFDWLYDLSTNDKMYCSEMIYKALKISTNNRIDCKLTSPPQKMLPLLSTYFKGKASREEISRRRIITIDNLYRVPSCKKLMEFRLKYFPGE
jgi:hypothetical protein